jgi:hypothetical protein
MDILWKTLALSSDRRCQSPLVDGKPRKLAGCPRYQQSSGVPGWLSCGGRQRVGSGKTADFA